MRAWALVSAGTALSAAREGACAQGPGCTRVGGPGETVRADWGIRSRVLAGNTEGPSPRSDGFLQPFNLGLGAYVG